MPTSFLDLEKIAEAKPKNLDNVVEAVRTFKKGMTGGAFDQARLQEAWSTSDFPILLGQGLDIELRNTFKEHVPEWTGLAYKTTTPDFRPKKLRELIGIGEFEDVAEAEEYKADRLSEDEREISVEKTGKLAELTFELIKNRDYATLQNLPARLVRAGRRTEDRKAFSSLIDPEGGPSKVLFKDVAAPTNLPLTAENLQTAWEALALRDGVDGEPVDLTDMYLVVHPSQKIRAERIVNSEWIETTEGKTTTREPNPYRGLFKIVAPRALQKYDVGEKAATTWYLIPGASSENPALAVAYLEGYEEPDIRYANNQGVAVGGRALGPEEGSIEADVITYRGRHIVGGAPLYNVAAYASLGS